MNLFNRLKVKKGLLRGSLIVTTSLLVTSCAIKKEDFETAVLVKTLQSDVLIDDVLQNSEIKLSDIEIFEKYLELSDLIESLNLKILVNMNSFKMNTNPQSILNLINEYKDLKNSDINEEEKLRIKKLEFMIYDYGTMINLYLSNEGYKLIVQYGYLVSNSLILDSCGLPIEDIDLITINKEDNNLMIGSMLVNGKGLKNVFEEIVLLENNKSFDDIKINKYSKKRNILYKDALQIFDKALLKDYYYQNGKILSKTNHSKEFINYN